MIEEGIIVLTSLKRFDNDDDDDGR